MEVTMRLQDKVTLITGAGSGQGRAAAVEFAREGSKLGLSDVDGAGLERTLQLVKQAGGEAVGVVGSVAEAAAVRDMVAETAGAFGKLNVLYNNAAIFWPHKGDAPVTELEEDAWHTVLNTNLTGVYLCCKYGIPELIKAGGGSVINIASIAGLRGVSRDTHAYTASKGGVIALTRVMASTYGPEGVRVNAIAPGAIDTPMTQITRDMHPERRRANLERTPLRRIGLPDEVARLALFLASDESSFITGTVQVIDGGSTVL
jgi:NAD(P)-dependent dehydrogenase (short-subunit alcohol dehydrogenase family)